MSKKNVITLQAYFTGQALQGLLAAKTYSPSKADMARLAELANEVGTSVADEYSRRQKAARKERTKRRREERAPSLTVVSGGVE